MTFSTTRSTRTKKPVLNNIIGDPNKPKTATIKRKKQLRTKKDNSSDTEIHQDPIDTNNTTIDPSEHQDYARLMNELEDSKQKKLKKIEMWREHEHGLILDWFSSQKKQALNEFYFARKKARISLFEEIQSKTIKIRQEISQLDRHSKSQYSECDYSDWVPPERLAAIGSFVDGATSEEIDQDLTIAKQLYNGNNTPNLIYSDYESRSTTDTPTEESDMTLQRIENTLRNQSPYHLYSDFNNRQQDG